MMQLYTLIVDCMRKQADDPTFQRLLSELGNTIKVQTALDTPVYYCQPTNLFLIFSEYVLVTAGVVFNDIKTEVSEAEKCLPIGISAADLRDEILEKLGMVPTISRVVDNTMFDAFTAGGLTKLFTFDLDKGRLLSFEIGLDYIIESRAKQIGTKTGSNLERCSFCGATDQFCSLYFSSQNNKNLICDKCVVEFQKLLSDSMWVDAAEGPSSCSFCSKPGGEKRIIASGFIGICHDCVSRFCESLPRGR